MLFNPQFIKQSIAKQSFTDTDLFLRYISLLLPLFFFPILINVSQEQSNLFLLRLAQCWKRKILSDLIATRHISQIKNWIR